MTWGEVMINFIGTDITKELLIIYSLIIFVVALMIIILIIDSISSKKDIKLANPKKNLKSIKKLTKNNSFFGDDDTIEDLESEYEENIVPISSLQVEEKKLEEDENELVEDTDEYIEEEIEKTQAQIEVEEITRALEEAQKEEREDPYKKFEEEQEQSAIISYKELKENFNKLYDENEKTQYINDDSLPIDIDELYQKNKEVLSHDKEKQDGFTAPASELNEAIESISQSSTGFKTSPVISPVYGIQKEDFQNKYNNNGNETDEEIMKTNEFLKTLKELQKNLD